MSQTHSEYTELLREIFTEVQRAGHEAWSWDEEFFQKRVKRYIHDVEFFKQHFTSGKVLEIGALPGHVSLFMKRLGFDITSVDIDPDRVRKFIEANDLNFIKCDIEKEPLPVEDGSYDAIIFTEVFEHMRLDPQFVLSEFNRVLSDNGMLFMSTPNLYSLDKYVRQIRRKGFNDPLEQFGKLRDGGHMGHVREYSVNEVTRFLGQAGFEIAESRFHNYHNYGGGIVEMAVKLLQTPSQQLKARQVHVARKKRTIEPLKPLEY